MSVIIHKNAGIVNRVRGWRSLFVSWPVKIEIDMTTLPHSMLYKIVIRGKELVDKIFSSKLNFILRKVKCAAGSSPKRFSKARIRYEMGYDQFEQIDENKWLQASLLHEPNGCGLC